MNEELLPVRLAIFASGAGTNAREIVRYFHEENRQILGHSIKISLIVCNKQGAGVVEMAERYGITTLIIEREKFFSGSHYLEELKRSGVSFIVLAGFLWKIPMELVRAFQDHIINIHPALLPSFGGKGMYGSAVHHAVIAAGEKQSGITIHYVDEQYDHGRVFFQTAFDLSPDETVESLTRKIHVLEHKHYPEEIAKWIESKLSLNHQ